MNTEVKNQCDVLPSCPLIDGITVGPCNILPPLPDRRSEQERRKACEYILAAKVLNMTGL